ncbi:MAG TPA: DinB family protein [Ktedonobacteraceae bacterium]|nr:DinB family protein [Ktedonobacteraceae bacterium]
MAEHPMETTLRTVLWQQFGAAIDMLDNALLACPSTLWHERIWSDSSIPDYPVFWNISFHTLFWLDFHLTGLPEEEFAPPAPFTKEELDPAGILPQRPFTKEELHGYLLQVRKKCQTTIAELSDEKARQPVNYPWARGKPVSFLELLLYSMRHVQEHAAQLSLFLGLHGVSDEALDWVARARG